MTEAKSVKNDIFKFILQFIALNTYYRLVLSNTLSIAWFWLQAISYQI